MELTEKAKELFKKWLYQQLQRNVLMENILELEFFETLPDSMQWGVYEGYFLDSHGIGISINMYSQLIMITDYHAEEDVLYIDCEEFSYMDLNPVELLNTYWKTAIEKANEIVNNR